MALAYNQQKDVVISLVLRDEGQNNVTKEFVVPQGVWNPATGLWADLVTIRDALVTAYNAVTDAIIYRAFVTIKQQEDTLLVGAANSEVENLASVILNLSTVGKTANLLIPAPAIGIFQGATGKDKNIVDITDAALNAFVDLYQVTGGSFTISDGELVSDTTPIDSGKRIHRKSSRG